MYQDYEQDMQDQQEGDGVTALNLQWVVGFNKDIDQGVHNLTTENRSEIFYTAAHSGVLYDYTNKTQKLLQGHCNQITATACSDDKRWIVTADCGDDSMLIVWDSYSGIPVRTFLNPHPNGIRCLDLSMDNQYLVTLGNDEPQTISLWDWTNTKEDGPIVSLQFKYTEQFQNQHWVKFNPNDPTELASNGTARVLFLNWEQGVTQFQYYSPRVEKRDFNDPGKASSLYTKTVFIPNSEMAVTGTNKGVILVWDRSLIVEGIGEQNEKRLMKVVNFSPEPITILTTAHDKYLVCGFGDGKIKFYDFQFKIMAWFDDLYFHRIKSISFSKKKPLPSSTKKNQLHYDEEEVKGKEKEEIFACSDFLVADESALICSLQSTLFEAIKASEKKGQTILCGIQSAICGISNHPHKSILAIATSQGAILLWDYLKKGDPEGNYNFLSNEDSNTKYSDGKVFTAIQFTPDGSEILVAMYNGEIKIMDSATAQFKKVQTPAKTSENKGYPIKQLIVSEDGKFFAVSDTNKAVSLFKQEKITSPQFPDYKEWRFAGKQLAHEVEVCSITFGDGLDENGMQMNRLFSVGLDRRVFEYDVYKSSRETELVVLRYFKIEQEALPSCCIWYPQKDSTEGLLLTSNDHYKMKVWNPSAENSRKTCLGPTYGGKIVNMKKLTIPNVQENYLIYSTPEKVIGLIKMPIDGNPNKTMGLIAHPKQITDFCASQDGRYLFTCGGEDLSVKMWSIDVNPIEQAIEFGGRGIEPFINLIEGGRDGQIFQDMKDFFYYSMIRSKDEDTTKTRKLDGTVPLTELPNLMRAMGYYPTEQEVSNMMDEVRFSVYSDMGDPTTSVDMETFIRLFVNHRPVYGIGKDDIDKAFQDLSDEKGSLQISRDDLINFLKQEGEAFTDERLKECLGYLVGKKEPKEALPKDFITSEEFASDLLGFEEFEEEEEEQDTKNNEDQGSGFNAAMQSGFGGMVGITEANPEEEGL